MRATRAKKPPPKVLISASIDADVVDVLGRYCRDNPGQSRSSVVNRALRRFLSPEADDGGVGLAEHLNRLDWNQQDRLARLGRQVRAVRATLGLLVRTFYNHTPEVPQAQRQAAADSGHRRYEAFLEELKGQLHRRAPSPGTKRAEAELDKNESAAVAAMLDEPEEHHADDDAE